MISSTSRSSSLGAARRIRQRCTSSTRSLATSAPGTSSTSMTQTGARHWTSRSSRASSRTACPCPARPPARSRPSRTRRWRRRGSWALWTSQGREDSPTSLQSNSRSFTNSSRTSASGAPRACSASTSRSSSRAAVVVPRLPRAAAAPTGVQRPPSAAPPPPSAAPCPRSVAPACLPPTPATREWRRTLPRTARTATGTRTCWSWTSTSALVPSCSQARLTALHRTGRLRQPTSRCRPRRRRPLSGRSRSCPLPPQTPGPLHVRFSAPPAPPTLRAWWPTCPQTAAKRRSRW
mmetsp:Transcript_38315/g.110690  ORF Transcript_38315/g.110690 Transcript_38315/m.110690 type:complete len:292 (+) Transcript_38315:390-1265(+)